MTTPTSNGGHGRRWMRRLQRYQNCCSRGLTRWCGMCLRSDRPKGRKLPPTTSAAITNASPNAAPSFKPVNTPTMASNTNAPTAIAAARDVSSIRRPAMPINAGSSVIDAIIITSTLRALATARPAHERQADDEQAEQRDDHRDAREHDGATGGVDRVHHGFFGLHPCVDVLAISADDEQRVVDADTESDHRGDLRGELGHPEGVGDDSEDAGAHAEPEQSGADRQSHRQHRSEGQHQDDHGGEDAEHLALGQFEWLEELAAVLDLQTGRALHRLAEVLDVVCQRQCLGLAALRHARAVRKRSAWSCC